MRAISFEQILVLIVLILWPLLHFMMRRIRGRVESEALEEEPMAPVPRRPRAAPPPPTRRRAAGERSRRLESPPIAAPLRRRRFTKRSLLETPQDARRGVILMTLLGPCRAFDPPGAQG